METYFSVGEISKLTNVPIQTLRYYDKMGLLKPDYINKQNNYRYYSINQFIKIDLLKQCKLIGLSLKEIEELLKSEITADSMIELIDQQRKVLDEKIKELESVKSYINFLEDRIKETKEVEENKIFIKYNDKRIVKKYNCIIRNQRDVELNLRKVLLEAEKENWILNSEIVFETSLDILKSEDKVVYTAIMLYKHENSTKGIDNVVLPKGKYLTMYYDDGYKNNLKYYQKMLDYIEKNNIETVGNFNEFSILSRINAKEAEKSIIQLEIQIK
ncbi:MerR family transcriptional regulator [Clostridium celatum]|uniref:Transcriptional regulator, MerR family n=1 Tax=Clostridium celatum DSM 1785 TaxID=545697 RepID=L1QEL5_9CLOT|nr:helix-turn-helix domain-containing protein [Clostridium celatum]EKY26371.1 transcriptional regulator, MerR family [Clostridium celatum DSM 1785]MCE9655821.1 helix-turn-helix domain-containing protein [Clostridium celatum]